MKRVLLADDHPLMIEGLIGILKQDYEIVGTAENGRDLVEKAKALRPDLVLLDVSMPEMNGIEAARRISVFLPGCRIIFITQQLNPEYVHAALEAGATAYVAKQAAGDELREALRLALKGQFFVTSLVPARDPNLRLVPGSKQNPAALFGSRLTSRQRDVLQLVAEGKAAKEIAATLNISVKTVEFHRNGLMNQLGLRTTAQLTRYAVTQGIVSD